MLTFLSEYAVVNVIHILYIMLGYIQMTNIW